MDASPTAALFDSYEADFKQIIHSIRDKLEGDAKGVQGEHRKAALRRVEAELYSEAGEMVRVPLPLFLLLYVESAIVDGTRWERRYVTSLEYFQMAWPHFSSVAACVCGILHISEAGNDWCACERGPPPSAHAAFRATTWRRCRHPVLG